MYNSDTINQICWKCHGTYQDWCSFGGTLNECSYYEDGKCKEGENNNNNVGDIEQLQLKPTKKEDIIRIIDYLCKAVHKTAKEKGWWDEEVDKSPGTKILLMVSELIEAMEAIRDPENVNEPPEIEFADCIIRIMDFCQQNDMPLATALIKKMKRNRDRPYRHGGKKF